MILQIIGMLALGVIGLLLIIAGAGLILACNALGAGRSDYIIGFIQLSLGVALFYFAVTLSPFSIHLAQP